MREMSPTNLSNARLGKPHPHCVFTQKRRNLPIPPSCVQPLSRHRRIAPVCLARSPSFGAWMTCLWSLQPNTNNDTTAGFGTACNCTNKIDLQMTPWVRTFRQNLPSSPFTQKVQETPVCVMDSVQPIYNLPSKQTSKDLSYHKNEALNVSEEIKSKWYCDIRSRLPIDARSIDSQE